MNSILILREQLRLPIIIHEEDIKRRQALLPRVEVDVGLLIRLRILLEAEDVVGEVLGVAEDVVGEIVVGGGTLVRDFVGAEAVAAVYVPEALVENVLSSAEFEETVVSAGAEVEEVVVVH